MNFILAIMFFGWSILVRDIHPNFSIGFAWVSGFLTTVALIDHAARKLGLPHPDLWARKR